MRGIGFLPPTARVRNVKHAKCYVLSIVPQQVVHNVYRHHQTLPKTHCCSVMNSYNVSIGRCFFHSSHPKLTTIYSGIDKLKYLHAVMPNNVYMSAWLAGDNRCLIHTSAVMASDSLGADSAGRTSAESAKQQFEKWKANIDFDLLTEAHKRIHSAHMKAIEEGKETYTDPVSDFEVFTIMTHLLRGSCCGNVCRHCPYRHVNAPKEYKEHMRYNTAFYY